MTAGAVFGQSGAEHSVWAQLRDLVGQMLRASGRDAWLADLRCVPKALRWALPWAVLGRTSRDANPCRWLAKQARRRRDTVAVSEPSRSITFEELRRESLEIAAALELRGVTANTRVAILIPTGIDLVSTVLGCWQLGAVPCPLDPGTPASVLAVVRAQLEPGLEVADYAEISVRPGAATSSHHEQGPTPSDGSAGAPDPGPLTSFDERSLAPDPGPLTSFDERSRALDPGPSTSFGERSLAPVDTSPTMAALSSTAQAARGPKQFRRKGLFRAAPNARAYARFHATDVAMILPTSGSEGHIKLCRITAGRLALSGHAFGGVALGCRRGDVIYCPLPLCHATGITVALMPALVHGVTLHLPGKFSASRLPPDLHRTGATQLVYVGDLLRMVVAALGRDADTSRCAGSTALDGEDASSIDAQHRSALEGSPVPSRSLSLHHGSGASISRRLRVAVGNGLDQRTYRRVAKALQMPRIVEFYGATEAPRVLLNLSNRPGSCGRVAFRRLSRFLVVKERVQHAQDESRVAHEAEPSAGVASSEQGARAAGGSERERSPSQGAARPDRGHREPRDERVTHDQEMGSVPAAAGGEWTPCGPGEVGELWIRIPSRKRPWLGDFEGYLDRDHEERVVLRDVFRSGDRFYRTYDLVRYDEDDYFYFVERLGKVWRNRGHNVSTTWMADEFRLANGIKDVSVFPVALDDSSRRFGLALVVTDDLERLRDALTNKIKNLPSYARPQLIQVVSELPRTLSFKPTSASLSKGGAWEPSDDASALYVWDNELRAIELPEWAETKRRLLAR
ncbi:MAG TPA: AMP-binding protein [Polyangiaceae bacterium]|nr:AMP-binding protein [Polyangiaceae bacterium]